MKPKDISFNPPTLDGVVIGMVMGLDPDRSVLVVFPGNPSDTAIPARTTQPMSSADIGCEVALMFEAGNPAAPIIVGRLLRPAEPSEIEEMEQVPTTVQIDGGEETTLVTGKEMIVLRCGRASISLTKAGKILLRGTYISSRSSGMNRIKGGSVHLN